MRHSHSVGCLMSRLINNNMRGIWKVLSMVFYLSNRFTNPILFGIILKSYLCWGTNYNADTKNIIVRNTCIVCILESAKFQWEIQHFTFSKVCRTFSFIHFQEKSNLRHNAGVVATITQPTDTQLDL